MTAVLQETHEMVRETARKFAEKTLAPMSAEIEEKKSFPPELFVEMGRLGLLGLGIPGSRFLAELRDIRYFEEERQ